MTLHFDNVGPSRLSWTRPLGLAPNLRDEINRELQIDELGPFFVELESDLLSGVIFANGQEAGRIRVTK